MKQKIGLIIVVMICTLALSVGCIAEENEQETLQPQEHTVLNPEQDGEDVQERTESETAEAIPHSSGTEEYNLFAPLQSHTTYLINMDGEVVHTWESDYTPGNAVYLRDDGSILRTGTFGRQSQSKFQVGGSGGIVERIDWDGDVVWTFEYDTGDELLHHDIEELPNGNILMIAWETMTYDEAVENGRDPSKITENEVWPDHIIEVWPSGSEGGEIVWEWHLKDHLIQDYDSTKLNYGDVSEHPELVDFNYIGTKGPNAGGADWTHINSIDYNEQLDQILLSVHGFNEIWIIDHSTTTQEAAGHEGGIYGRGGDLLFRWGNPEAYDAGSQDDKVFYAQHDAKWIETEGENFEILVFNNGLGRGPMREAYSTVDQISVPVDEPGNYLMSDAGRYLPETICWTYQAEEATSFYSSNISGAQRLSNGNTLICDGDSGWFFEVDTSGNVVWEYTNTFTDMKQPKNSTGSPVFRVERYALDLDAYDGIAN